MTYSGLLFKLFFQEQDANPPFQGRTSSISLSAGTLAEHKRRAIYLYAKLAIRDKELLPLSGCEPFDTATKAPPHRRAVAMETAPSWRALGRQSLRSLPLLRARDVMERLGVACVCVRAQAHCTSASVPRSRWEAQAQCE